jgi:hypothetical protein
MPAQLNPLAIGSSILGNYSEFLPGVLNANANALPQFQGQQNQLTIDQLYGRLDTQAFLRQHPEFQEPYEQAVARGEDISRWLPAAIANASYINPADLPRSGGLLQQYGAATNALGTQQAAANTQQRTADIADVEALGGRANAAFQAANPQLRQQMDLLSGRINGANTPFSAALPTLGAAPTAATTAAAQSLAGNATLGPALGATQSLAVNANLGPAGTASAGYLGQANVSTLSRAYGSPLMGRLEGDAARNLGAFTPLQQQLAQQAQTNLASSGYLTAEGRRTAAQAARQAAADRGVALGNGAIFEEALNSENLRQQRMDAAQRQALAIDANGQQQTTANRGYAANVAGMGNQLSTFNAGQANATDQFNTAARNTFDLTRYGQEADVNKFNTGQQNSFDLASFGAANDTARYNAGQANALAQFNTGQQNTFDLTRYGQESQNNQFNAGQANSLATYNAGQANNAAQFNAGQQSQFDLARYGQEAQGAQFNAQFAAQQGQQQIGNSFNLANAYASQAQDPFALVLGRSNATAQGQGAVNGATANTGALMQTYGANPFDPSQTSIYNANFNAQNQAAADAKNRSSSLLGAGIGAVGTLGGALLGGPAGAKLGGFLGGLFCWAARAAYGERNPRWLAFREWMLTHAPRDLFALYCERAESLAARIALDPALAAEVRGIMDRILARSALLRTA